MIIFEKLPRYKTITDEKYSEVIRKFRGALGAYNLKVSIKYGTIFFLTRRMNDWWKIIFDSIFKDINVHSVYFLNDVLIDLYGINGAAISTLIVLSIFTILKVLFIRFKLKINPYNLNTIKILLIVLVLYLSIGYIGFMYSAFLDILLRSLIVSIIYMSLIYYLGLSKSINQIIRKILKI